MCEEKLLHIEKKEVPVSFCVVHPSRAPRRMSLLCLSRFCLLSLSPKQSYDLVAMTTRKNSKAKAKKAAKARVEAEKEQSREAKIDSLVLQQMRRQITGRFARPGRDILGQCSHGNDVVPEGDICREFLDAYIDKFDSAKDFSESLGIGEAFLATAEKYVEVWNDVTKVDSIVSIFVSNGTYNILDGNIDAARHSSFFACYFEQYVETALRRKKATINWHKVEEFGMG